jgi:hypothetical protein
MLAPGQIDAFLADGYLVLRGAIPAETVTACESVIWSRLLGAGVLRDDPASWSEPVVRVDCPEGGPFAEAGTAPALWEAYDQLIGPGRWWRRQGLGGTIPVRFPGDQDPGDAGWHIESSYQEAGDWRVNVHSRERGLLTIVLLTDVTEEGAPTRVRTGSHLDVPAVLAPAGEDGLGWLEACRRAVAASEGRPEALAAGRAGDVYLCHPFLVHAASWPHRGRLPRMIAQPGVALLEPYPLTGRSGEVPPWSRRSCAGSRPACRPRAEAAAAGRRLGAGAGRAPARRPGRDRQEASGLPCTTTQQRPGSGLSVARACDSSLPASTPSISRRLRPQTSSW